MTEAEYDAIIDGMLLSIEEAIDQCEDVDMDYESADGMLTLVFPDRSKIVLNKQPPLLQLWMATKYNGHHFNLEGDQWIDERTGVEFWSFLDEACSRQAGQTMTLGAAAK